MAPRKKRLSLLYSDYGGDSLTYYPLYKNPRSDNYTYLQSFVCNKDGCGKYGRRHQVGLSSDMVKRSKELRSLTKDLKRAVKELGDVVFCDGAYYVEEEVRLEPTIRTDSLQKAAHNLKIRAEEIEDLARRSALPPVERYGRYKIYSLAPPEIREKAVEAQRIKRRHSRMLSALRKDLEAALKQAKKQHQEKPQMPLVSDTQIEMAIKKLRSAGYVVYKKPNQNTRRA